MGYELFRRSLFLAAGLACAASAAQAQMNPGEGLFGRGAKPAFAPAEELPPEAKKVVEEFEGRARKIRAKAESEIDKLRDEALAIRGQVRRLNRVQPDPGVLRAGENDIGKSFYFEVLGDVKGSLWGTDTYTTDSTLASAAVHAGVLKPGEKGVVKVTIMPGEPSYQGSTRNGVSSSPWGAWKCSFSVEKYAP
ncbi:MAG: hypothetical protein CO113_15565 [Elusimicrobia bacterium CG_4_9_14_3_um_filter_62_55]|nr:MAG: hypothetical protein COR54_06940 [Elusimicrobia bacterium CG22_combo_CG10-13_8_21_14_all_63_91]PJA11754.1 MAG: hypothetical protein COX66_19015 [Elusimicrobia bacterium CG_4_10_14_0_2_um_filter_63_34]PJB24125.1 MAG: hypothetical protein CO113_15565 [Elusimicrobia bacterium CG_4_9_14_3_um_filter_62_55]